MTPKIKVLQFIYGDLSQPGSYFDYVEKINRLYCTIHGYEYIVDRRETIRDDRHGNWTKVESIRDHLTDCDYLFYLDADVCFYAHVLKIEEELLPLLTENKCILVASDKGGEVFNWNSSSINAGVILIKNMPKSHEIIDYWNSVSDIVSESRWQFPWEQLALCCEVRRVFDEHFYVLTEYYLICSFCGQYIRHIFGACGLNRLEEFKKIWESSLMERNRSLLQPTEL